MTRDLNTTTRFALPLSDAVVHELDDAIAIVDDDPQISQALGQWVELQGLRAMCFSCAECLLDALMPGRLPLTIAPRTIRAPASILVAGILDLNLPGLSGMALAHMLRQMDGRLPLVIVTALREKDRQHYGALPAGVPCLQKPFDLDALERALFPTQMHPTRAID